MENQQHIIMLPFMAQGHLIPFVSLATIITRRYPNITVTILSTPRNTQSLANAVPDGVLLVALPYRSEDFGLSSENTDSVPFASVRLYESSESLEPHFHQFLANFPNQNNGQLPLLIIGDFLMGWTMEIARRFNIFHASFTTCGAYGTAAYVSLWVNLPHSGNDLPEFGIPGFPESWKIQRNQMSSYMSVADGTDAWSKYLRRQILMSLQADAIVCNTVEEVETEGLRLLRTNSGRTVWPVGPLVPLDSSSSGRRSGRNSETEVSFVMKWMDTQKQGSLIYVSFGSQNNISCHQMISLAKGLESSGHPFIWVVREPAGFDVNSNSVDEWLPNGFVTRMNESGRGIIIRKWGPQLEILSHVSTGAFLSHCGWNSVLESFSRGIPMIGWPLASEQFYNAKMLEEEMGVGIELARGTVMEVASEAVTGAIRMVMEEDKGREMKAKAMKLKEMIRDAMIEEGEEKGSSIRSLDGLIEMAISSRSTS